MNQNHSGSAVPAVRVVISPTGIEYYPLPSVEISTGRADAGEIGLELAREIGRALARQHHSEETAARARLAAPEKHPAK